MQRTTTLTLAAGLACLLGGATPATAQVPGYGAGYSQPYSRPYVSPYLNLLRGGGANAGFNYFTLVRPQINAQAGINQLAFQAGQNQQAINTLQQANASGLVTGHPVGFMTHLSYFQNYSGGGAPGFAVGVPGGGAGAAPGGGQGFQGAGRGAAPAAPRRGR